MDLKYMGRAPDTLPVEEKPAHVVITPRYDQGNGSFNAPNLKTFTNNQLTLNVGQTLTTASVETIDNSRLAVNAGVQLSLAPTTYSSTGLNVGGGDYLLFSASGALAELNLSLDAQLDALGRANLELHEMNQVRTEFLANMSHELRSPLHSVLGFAQILLEETYGPLTARQRRYVQNMVSSGRDLLHLINNLLEMSRIEAGRMQKNLDRVPLADLVHPVVAKLEPLRGDTLTVTVEVQEDLPPVFIDPRKTSRILSNLLSNAYKFTPEGGRVSVRGAMEDDRLVLSVSDTGIGIQDCDLARIFDKFRQVDSGTGRRFEGSGLGLAIVRELARFLGGEVTVKSTPGEGSTFTVTLPLVAGETGVSPTLEGRADAPGEPAGE